MSLHFVRSCSMGSRFMICGSWFTGSLVQWPGLDLAWALGEHRVELVLPLRGIEHSSNL